MKRTQSNISFGTSTKNNSFYHSYFGDEQSSRRPGPGTADNYHYYYNNNNNNNNTVYNELQMQISDMHDMYDRLRSEYNKLKKDVDKLRCEVQGVAEESSMWTLKYSRRFLITSNILLACYLLSNRILQILNDHSRTFLSSVMNPFTWLSFSRKNRSSGSGGSGGIASLANSQRMSSYKAFKRQFMSTMKKDTSSSSMISSMRRNSGSSIQYVIMKLVWKQLVLAGLLLFSSYWVGSARVDWKRRAGVIISFFTNVHLALTSDVSPWTIYLNCFTLLLYITARHIKNKPLPKALQTIRKSLSMSSLHQRLSPTYSFQKMQHKLLQDMDKEDNFAEYKVINFDYASSPVSAPPVSASDLKRRKQTAFADVADDDIAATSSATASSSSSTPPSSPPPLPSILKPSTPQMITPPPRPNKRRGTRPHLDRHSLSPPTIVVQKEDQAVIAE